MRELRGLRGVVFAGKFHHLVECVKYIRREEETDKKPNIDMHLKYVKISTKQDIKKKDSATKNC